MSFKRFCELRRSAQTCALSLVLASTLGVLELVTDQSLDSPVTSIAYGEEVFDGQDHEVRISLSNGDLVLTDNVEEDRALSYAGELAVWQQLRQAGWEVVYWTAATGTVRLTDDIDDDTQPATDGRYIVWQRLQEDRSRIVLFDSLDPAAGMRQISDGKVTSQSPKIENGHVVWEAWVGSNWEVMSWSESEGLVRMTINTTPDIDPDVSANYVVWEGVDPQGFDRDIFAADLQTHKLLVLTDNGSPDGTPEFREDGKLSWLLTADVASIVRVTTDVSAEFLWSAEAGEEIVDVAAAPMEGETEPVAEVVSEEGLETATEAMDETDAEEPLSSDESTIDESVVDTVDTVESSEQTTIDETTVEDTPADTPTEVVPSE